MHRLCQCDQLGAPGGAQDEPPEGEGSPLTYKAYIDNIYAKTGKRPENYRKMAKEKGLTEHADLLKWLKTECGLGHGHANAIILYIRDPELARKKIAEDAKKE